MILSIIVPVYNVAAYLDRCIVSLLNQGLDSSEYEIILVNDGSTDNSLEICQRYAGQYGQIRLITQENQGLGAARNAGMFLAKGEYICFVDSDDYLDDKGLSKLIRWCDGTNDGIRYWCRILDGHSNIDDSETEEGCYDVMTGTEYLTAFGLETFCWNWLYKKAFLDKQNLEFDVIINEDFRFISSFLLANPMIVSTSYRFYNLVVRDGSITTSKDPKHLCRGVNDTLETLLILKEKLLSYKDIIPAMYDKCMSSLQSKVPHIFSRIMGSNLSNEEYLEIVNCCREEGLLPLPTQKDSITIRIINRGINFICQYPSLLPFAKYLHNHFFIPLLKPRLNRYK